MKKILIAIMALMIAASAVACGSDDSSTTTAATTTAGAATTTAAGTTTAATTTAAETTTAATTTAAAPATTETPEVDYTPSDITWADNNGETAYYEITENDDGSVHVSYTKETYEDAEANYGYAGYSWVNMTGDVTEAYTGQSKFFITVKGTAGETLLIKPFDNQSLEQTITFNGAEQQIAFNLAGISDPASKYIILMGAAGATDVSGEFDIISAGFAD